MGLSLETFIKGGQYSDKYRYAEHSKQTYISYKIIKINLKLVGMIEFKHMGITKIKTMVNIIKC